MDVLAPVWPPLLAAFQIGVAVVASAHAVLFKRDVRAAIGWIGLIWLVPESNRPPARCVYLFGSGRLPDALLLALSSADGPAPRRPAPRKRIPLEIVEDAHPA